jgi:hypothetical protein
MTEDTTVLARAVADSLVIAVDDEAADAALIFWHWSRAFTLPVVEALEAVPDEALLKACRDLRCDTHSSAAYAAVIGRLGELVRDRRELLDDVFARAWTAVGNCRLGFHLGLRYRQCGAGPVALRDLVTAGPSTTAGGPGGDPAATVVVPFRDSTGAGERIRNVVACLRALNDQSAQRRGYRTVLVESDEIPRWREILEPLCDLYVFAPKGGEFNKSWAVNVAVRTAPADFDVLCILDADALPDRDFIARNVQRFAVPGAQALLPYRDALFLDEPSTCAALRDRVLEGRAAAEWERLRGFLVRRNPGLCFWIRAGVFHAVGGMDERFEGWGGEDTDFALRVSVKAALDRYDDRILHLHHQSSSAAVDGRITNAHIPLMSWPSDADFGRVDRFRAMP